MVVKSSFQPRQAANLSVTKSFKKKRKRQDDEDEDDEAEEESNSDFDDNNEKAAIEGDVEKLNAMILKVEPERIRSAYAAATKKQDDNGIKNFITTYNIKSLDDLLYHAISNSCHYPFVACVDLLTYDVVFI